VNGKVKGPESITLDAVAGTLRRYSAIYRYLKPRYQTIMLQSLHDVWNGPHERILDVGGGTGVIAQCLAEHFPTDKVTAIDVADRFHPDLSIDHAVYNGEVIPFADQSFDAVTMNNVLHHVPRAGRTALLREIARVSRGPLYIKDHLPLGALDNARLAALDFIGNVPFGGMVQAKYLPMEEWQKLADDTGFKIREMRGGEYRSGPFAMVFPNRLEITMRWDHS
jgi:2-polyprenyl-3-methyl-5-hydroxy-6-metoxy-1,4-benzoquinol methylase